jgi:hypothetical protein
MTPAELREPNRENTGATQMFFDIIYKREAGSWCAWTSARDLEEAWAVVAELESTGLEAGLVLVGFERKSAEVDI